MLWNFVYMIITLFQNPGSAGDIEFYIDVKDADGNVARSAVMNVITK